MLKDRIRSGTVLIGKCSKCGAARIAYHDTPEYRRDIQLASIRDKGYIPQDIPSEEYSKLSWTCTCNAQLLALNNTQGKNEVVCIPHSTVYRDMNTGKYVSPKHLLESPVETDFERTKRRNIKLITQILKRIVQEEITK